MDTTCFTSIANRPESATFNKVKFSRFGRRMFTVGFVLDVMLPHEEEMKKKAIPLLVKKECKIRAYWALAG